MENQTNSSPEPIAVGAVVEASNGFIGTVVRVVTEPQAGRVLHLVVENEEHSKQFTLPASLIAGQMGSRIVHLSITRDQILDYAEDVHMDTQTGNMGHPMSQMPSGISMPQNPSGGREGTM